MKPREHICDWILDRCLACGLDRRAIMNNADPLACYGRRKWARFFRRRRRKLSGFKAHMIIIDDPHATEDLTPELLEELRQKTREWFTSRIVPDRFIKP
jgi:hypothetical protein